MRLPPAIHSNHFTIHSQLASCSFSRCSFSHSVMLCTVCSTHCHHPPPPATHQPQSDIFVARFVKLRTLPLSRMDTPQERMARHASSRLDALPDTQLPDLLRVPPRPSFARHLRTLPPSATTLILRYVAETAGPLPLLIRHAPSFICVDRRWIFGASGPRFFQGSECPAEPSLPWLW